MVLNDEAHHAYRPAAVGENERLTADDRAEREEAKHVWPSFGSDSSPARHSSADNAQEFRSGYDDLAPGRKFPLNLSRWMSECTVMESRPRNFAASLIEHVPSGILILPFKFMWKNSPESAF
jgi:hypothetical protein